ncbi:protein canopy homolog 1-like isoform X2 [Styela clava]|uniref:protein canopy homolog 1-like isoform X2 n=1 Tax=Styela clava TaxID=7725 RepID=UPI00193A6DFA|nr:protein canopy homolog 1-like isoform X2 [Styela clava]
MQLFCRQAMILRWTYSFLHLSLIQYIAVSGKKDLDLYCGACKAIVNEVEYIVNKVDPKKTIDVGTFRLDPNGKQKSSKVSYARSEIHLTELLEDVCSKMNGYAESKSDSGKREYVRTSSRDGEAIALNNISISGDISKKLKYACESIIEDHEDEFVALFAKGDKNIIEKVCRDLGEYCKDEQTKDEL